MAEHQNQVIGFAYAHAYHPKEAYGWDTELTIYLRHGLERQGIGFRLMDVLLKLLRKQGFLLAYSCITLPNAASIGLHKRFGFTELGIFPRSGYKLGRWHDVIWLQLPLAEAVVPPAAPVPFSALNPAEVQQIISM